MTTEPLPPRMVRTADDARRAIEKLEQSETWGYEDRDLLCRLLRYMLQRIDATVKE